MGKYVGIAILVIICFILLERIIEKTYSDKLLDTLIKNPSEFEKMVDSKMIKLFIKPFNREYMRLNYYMMLKSKKDIENQIEKLEILNLSKKQKEILYQTSFQYYLTQNDEKGTKQIQKKINKFVDEHNLNPEMKEAIDMEIKIYFQKDLSTLLYIDKRIDTCLEEERSNWYYKKSDVLKFNHRKEEAKVCLEKAIELAQNDSEKELYEELLKKEY